jgi:hypothetical protein
MIPSDVRLASVNLSGVKLGERGKLGMSVFVWQDGSGLQHLDGESDDRSQRRVDKLECLDKMIRIGNIDSAGPGNPLATKKRVDST